MATIAELIVGLTANTRRFDSRMRASRDPVRQLAEEVEATRTRLLRFGSALLAVAGGAGIFAMTRSVLNGVDAVAKLSDRLGVATEDIGRFQHAAQISGASVEDANNGLERLARMIGEATQGIGSGASAFEQLGLSARDLGSMGVSKAMLEIADRLSQIEDAAQRSAIAYQIFGRQGQRLTNMLMLNRGELAALFDEADRLGVTVSRDMAASVEDANDALTRMRASIRGLAQSVVVAATPAIKSLSDTIAGVAMYMRNLDRRTIDTIASFAKWGIATLAVIKIGKALVAIIQTIIVAKKAMVASQIAVLAFAGPKGWAVIAAGATVAAFAIAGTAAAFDHLGQQISDSMEDARKAGESVREVGDALRGVQEDMEGYDKALRDQSDGIMRIIGPLEQQRRELELSSEEMLRFRLAMTAATPEVVEYALALHAAIGELQNLQEAHRMIDRLEEMRATFGMSAREIDLWRLSMLGASEEIIRQVEELWDAIEAMQEHENALRRAEHWIDRIATPYERFKRDLEEVNDLFRRGLLDAEQYARAVEHLEQGLANSQRRMGSGAAPRAIERRFTEGFGHRRGPEPIDRVNQTLRETQRIEQAQERLLNDIERAVRDVGSRFELTVLN